MNDPILQMLLRLRERPAMYIGCRSAEALFLYLAGYRDAVEASSGDTSAYRAFVESLYEKYGRGGGGHSWAFVLGQIAGGDAAALDLFFEELSAFVRLQRQPAACNGGSAKMDLPLQSRWGHIGLRSLLSWMFGEVPPPGRRRANAGMKSLAG